jgi:hypothetical protein
MSYKKVLKEPQRVERFIQVSRASMSLGIIILNLGRVNSHTQTRKRSSIKVLAKVSGMGKKKWLILVKI